MKKNEIKIMKRRKFLKATTLGTLSKVDMRANGLVNMVDQQKQEIVFNRNIPVRFEADVAVIGGGIAGVSAACSAAKSGANVILVERFASTGGVLTTGGVANFCGRLTGQGEVFDHIIDNLKAWNAIGYDSNLDKDIVNPFHHGILEIVLQEMLLQRKVKLLLHTRFVDCCVKKGMINEVILCGKSGLEALRSRQFIDCTGDADVARSIGHKIMKGNDADGTQLPMSMMCFVRHITGTNNRYRLPKGWFNPIKNKEEFRSYAIWPNGPGGNALKIKIPPIYDATNSEEITEAEIYGRRRMMEVLDYYQEVEKKPWMLDHCSPIIGVREGARIVGLYVLKVEDLMAGRHFDDAIALSEWHLDHARYQSQKEVPPYQIPLRCLTARDIKNLMMAGRCFSGDWYALSSARVSTTGAMMGQAAGIAAALAAKNGCTAHDLDFKQVRNIVEERGAQLYK
jgi:hypothetical protein